MSFEDKATYYDILEIQPDASSREIQEAYTRAKSAYTRDSVALYTLISADEREEALRKIEEAYAILSNPERRVDYDKCHGVWSSADQSKIISIDRVPPMSMPSSNLPEPTEDILIAPSTDFSGKNPPPAPTSDQPTTEGTSPLMLDEQIAQEVEWHGNLLKRVREARGISIEEMAAITKISKSNIIAIEDENFSKFPASVYLRGFLTQISKVLKLPHDRVAAAYLVRYNQSRPSQAQ